MRVVILLGTNPNENSDRVWRFQTTMDMTDRPANEWIYGMFEFSKAHAELINKDTFCQRDWINMRDTADKVYFWSKNAHVYLQLRSDKDCNTNLLQNIEYLVGNKSIYYAFCIMENYIKQNNLLVMLRHNVLGKNEKNVESKIAKLDSSVADADESDDDHSSDEDYDNKAEGNEAEGNDQSSKDNDQQENPRKRKLRELCKSLIRYRKKIDKKISQMMEIINDLE